MAKNRVKSFFLIVIGWMAAIEMFIVIRFFGIQSIPQFRDTDLSAIDPPWLIFMGAVLGMVVGAAYFLVDRILDNPTIRRRPYGALIVLQTVGNLGFVVVALLIISVFEVMRGETLGLLASVSNRLFTINFLIILLYVTLVSFLFSFFKTVDRKFGPGNLWKLIIGTYYHPKEEELIFMFLDLKGSTTHAERLGHVRFSELIQDCFIDLTVVIDHEALVYQYVGDEAILYWDVESGLTNANCARAYFQFADRLKSRTTYYETKYGITPEFKAGINIGKATVLEVGEIKRDISYLGDVLNTAARIQGKCNDFDEELLVSGLLKDRFTSIPDDLKFSELGKVDLRGREEAVAIFGVQKK